MLRVREAVLRRDLARMLQDLAGVQSERGALRSEVDALRCEADANRAAVAEIQAVVARHVGEIARLRREMAERDHLIAAMYASRSWRVAAPARAVSTMFRQMVGRAGTPNAGMLLLSAPAFTTPAEQAAPEQAAVLRRRRTILVAADMLPLFDQSSGGQRLAMLMVMMRDAGWSIVFGSMADLGHQPGVLASPEGRARYEAAIRKRGVVRFLYGSAEIGSFLAEAGGDLDCAFLSFPAIAAELLPLVRSYCPTARVIYDMVDFHALRIGREAALRDDPELLAEAERQRVIEVSCARAADVTVAVTEDERAALLGMAPDVVVEALPNVFEVPRHAPAGLAGREGLLFVGGFWHQPNGDAMHWFVDRIWPLIRLQEPSLVLRIAGANAGDDVLALGSRPGVEVLGYVPDLVPLFHQHRAFVAPLRYGAGMKGKVGQSLAQGLPVVATSIGAEGMGLEHGVHLLVADQEEEFASQVLCLLRDDALWSRLSAAGRAHIERTLSVDVVRTRLEALLNG